MQRNTSSCNLGQEGFLPLFRKKQNNIGPQEQAKMREVASANCVGILFEEILTSKSINALKISMKELPEFKFCEVYWHILEHDRNTAKRTNRIHNKHFCEDDKHSHVATKHVRNIWL